MAIGTSLGAYFEDEFHHQAGMDTPPEVVKPADTGDDNVVPPSIPDEPSSSGVTRASGDLPATHITIHPDSPQIENRRDEDYGSPKWSNILPNLRDMAVSTGNSLWGTPSIPEAPDTPLSDQLGKKDIKIEPNVGQSLAQRAVDDTMQGANFFKGIYQAMNGKDFTPTSSPELDAPLFAGTTLGNKLFGMNGVERHQLWPERMVRDLVTSAHDVGSGKVPMWAMTPEGDFHTSIEGIEHAQSLMPAANGGGVPLRVQLHSQAVEALHEGPGVFRQFMATRGNRQASNITEQPLSRYPEQDARMGITPGDHRFEQEPFEPGSYITRGRHPDSLSDEEFLRWGEHQPENGMTPAQEDRWVRLDVEEGERRHRREESSYQDHLDESFREEAEHRQTVSKRRIEEAKAQFENNPDVVKKGNVSLVPDKAMTEGARVYGNRERHYYNFMSDKGIPGELTVDLSHSRTIHVAWIGTIGSRGPMEVGKSEIKNLFKLLADQYPDAREITGFRVSGARAETGRIGNAAMKIPGR